MPEHDPNLNDNAAAIPGEEHAAEYVLGQLEGRAKSEFESRLASSPALRNSVQELEAACEALALSSPQMRPQKRVWERIASRTKTHETPAPAQHGSSAWDWLRAAWRGGWVFAGGIALAWLAREWMVPDIRPSARPPEMAQAAPSIAQQSEPNLRSPQPARGPEGSTRTGLGSSPAPGAPASANASEETQRLRAWIQDLAQEVDKLHRSLARQATVPAGAKRLQIFRLGPTNTIAASAFASGTDAGGNRSLSAQERALDRWLASAIAGQLVVLTDSTSTTGQPNPSLDENHTTVPDLSPPTTESATNLASLGSDNAPGSFQVVELASAPPGSVAGPLSDAAERSGAPDTLTALGGATAAMGFYSTDTGLGTIALVAGQQFAGNQTLQVWAMDNQTGTTISLGTTAASPNPLLFRFSVDTTALNNPNFFITLEPSGGSQMPTGPVLVGPPTTNPTPSP